MPRLSSHARIEVQEANEFTERMESLTKHLRNEIRWAQEIYEEKANRSRNPAPAYKEGDRVWLNTKNITTKRFSKKLDWKWCGPYKVTKVVSPYAYRLQLPLSMKVHPVFHTSLLRLVASPDLAIPGQVEEEPLSIEVDSEDKYTLEQIEDARIRPRYHGSSPRYDLLVRWKGYPEPT
jgi:hypothetical protein